jgi:hypothetical protein
MANPEPSMPRKCRNCDASAGPRTKLFCDYHAGYNAGHSVAFMRYQRLISPKYREAERAAVKKRMRKLRADPGYVRPEKRVTA